MNDTAKNPPPSVSGADRPVQRAIQRPMFARILSRLRRRAHPPVLETGILEIGSDAFRRAAALHKDGTLHVIKSDSVAAFAELAELQRIWHLPRIRDRQPATPVSLETLYGRRGQVPGMIQRHAIAEDGLTIGAQRLLAVTREAASLGASDLKLFIRQTHADLRLKVGADELTHGQPWPVSDATEAIAYLFDQRAKGGGENSQQQGEYQSFAISADGHVPLPDGVVSLRGQKAFHADFRDCVVMRLFYSREAHEAGRLETLGFDEDVLEVLSEERRSESGLVIIGGSTGDGKSTTLVRQLERLYKDRDGRVSIYTIEDPVEYPIIGEGIAQFPVPSAAAGKERSAVFAKALLNFVRSNPDIGMVSEIRSGDDARAILQFVISGHKVFTTIHSFSANAVLFRLISLGVNPCELSEPGVISLVMRQKLVPILCPDCAKPATPAQAAWIAKWASQNHSQNHSQARWHPRMRNHQGCPTCLAGREGATAVAAWGGLSRRRAVAEFIKIDDTYLGFVEARDARGAQHYWTTPVSEGGMGGRTVQDRMAALIAAGELDYTDATHDMVLHDILEPGPLLLPKEPG